MRWRLILCRYGCLAPAGFTRQLPPQIFWDQARVHTSDRQRFPCTRVLAETIQQCRVQHPLTITRDWRQDRNSQFCPGLPFTQKPRFWPVPGNPAGKLIPDWKLQVETVFWLSFSAAKVNCPPLV